jgi:hypothetical protein
MVEVTRGKGYSTIHLDLRGYIGSNVKDIAKELLDLGAKLGIDCFCDVNGVTVRAYVGDTPEKVYEQWNAEMTRRR